jgi:hypothetical protein
VLPAKGLSGPFLPFPVLTLCYAPPLRQHQA